MAYSIYDAGPYASILFTPSDSGLTTISIMLDDGEAVNNTTSMEFDVRSYLNLNSAPTVDTPEDLVIAPDAGEQVITLTGISDGDGNVQTLTITAVSSADTIVAAPSVEYSGGGAALLRLTPNPATTGISTISVTVSDDGGSDTNNGDLDTEVSFKVETLFLNKKGYVVPLTQADSGMWYFENEGAAYNVTFGNSGEFETMEITMTGKSTWDGMWLTLQEELNLSEHPYISYEIYSAGQPTYHWNYFYNNPPDRNEKNSREHMYMVPANEWTLLSFDYSDPGDMQTNEVEEINGERIKAVLFNLHDSPGSWPFTRNRNEKGIIKAEKVQAIALSYDSETDTGLPSKCKSLYLTHEIFAPTAEKSDNILKYMEDSVNYWREFIPEDGMTLDTLI